LRRAWAQGTRDPRTLARRFGVTQAAVKLRLLQLGLIEPTSHCLTDGA
jgi:Zn-dependent peptidase ImmA (M78 family)